MEEIESVLSQHPAVKGSVIVVGDRDSSEEKELIGYVVPRRTVDFCAESETCKASLKDKLPGYMVPSAFVVLDALTANSKRENRPVKAATYRRTVL